MALSGQGHNWDNRYSWYCLSHPGPLGGEVGNGHVGAGRAQGALREKQACW